MQKNNGLEKGKLSIGAAIKEYYDIIKNLNVKVLTAVVALVMILSSFEFVTKNYTVAYDVYYGGVNVGVTTSKEEAMEMYTEAETDIAECNLGALEHELKFVMTIAPVNTLLNSDIYRGFVDAAEGSESCYGIEVDGLTITKVRTIEEATEAVDTYVKSFGRENADIIVNYSFVPQKDVVTKIKSVEGAIEDIMASAMLTVAYKEVLEENVTIYYEESYVENADIPKGLTVTAQEGSNGVGMRTITYYENGYSKQSSTVELETIVEAVDAIYYVGTGEFTGIEKNSMPWPTEGIFTSEFGARWGRNHNGIDIAAKTGTPIYAPCNGVVTFSGVRNGYGNYVTIDHGAGYVTTYAHMNKACVTEGMILRQGDLIGEIGTTGRVTGAHLHFEILLNGEFVDPMDYIAG